MPASFYSYMLNGFLLSVFLIVGLRPIAREMRLVDLPDFRKRHAGEVPLCGGLAIITAFMMSGVGFPEAYRIPWNWELGLGMLALVGLADDRWQLSAVLRLVLQMLLAALLIAGAAGTIFVLGRSGDGIWYLSAPAATIFSILFLAGTVNAVNMLDGLDGVAGASVVAALFWLALIAGHADFQLIEFYALVFIAAVLGFLAFNMRHPWRRAASVFLGDAGSMFLGGAVATFIIHLCSGGEGVSFAAVIWVIIVPVADTLSLIVRRMASGRSPLSADRWHLHHLIQDLGVSPAITAVLIAAAAAVFGAVAYASILLNIPDIYLAAGLVIPFGAHTALVWWSRSRSLGGISAPQPTAHAGIEMGLGNESVPPFRNLYRRKGSAE